MRCASNIFIRLLFVVIDPSRVLVNARSADGPCFSTVKEAPISSSDSTMASSVSLPINTSKGLWTNETFFSRINFSPPPLVYFSRVEGGGCGYIYKIRCLLFLAVADRTENRRSYEIRNQVIRKAKA